MYDFVCVSTFTHVHICIYVYLHIFLNLYTCIYIYSGRVSGGLEEKMCVCLLVSVCVSKRKNAWKGKREPE